LDPLVLIGAAFAFAYQEFGEAFVPGYNGTESYYRGLTIAPLRDYALPLILGGVALFTVGFAIMLRSRVIHGTAV
jgi:hypothetical protein